jgi:pre-60S factor REI1
MIGLPALLEDQYDTQVKPQETVHRPKGNDEQWKKTIIRNDNAAEYASVSGDISEVELESSKNPRKIPPTQCLFCDSQSSSLNANIDHMSSRHGLFIPSPDRLSDLESFFSYLATIIFSYNECLFCSLEKSTVEGVQTHMRDKGHCKIKLSADSELLDFWERSDDSGDDDTTIKLSSTTEMRLPSGAVVNSRAGITQLRARPGLAQSRTRGLRCRNRREEMRAITTGEKQDVANEKPVRNDDRRVTGRGERGLAGVSESQRLALQVTERKMNRREAVAKAAQRYAMEQEPMKTKYYKVDDV